MSLLIIENGLLRYLELGEYIKFNEFNPEIFCIEKYSNHLGNVDNFLTTSVLGDATATEDAGAHRMMLLSGVSASARSAYSSASQFSVGAQHTIFNCVLSSISAGTGANKTAYIGFFNSLVTPGNVIAFFQDTDDTWHCKTISQTSGGTTDTPISALATYDHLTVVISKLNSFVRAVFYVNGLVVAKHTTNIETIFTMNLGAFTRSSTNAGTSRTINISYIGFEKYPL
jgi:hypothetical protein